MAASTSWVGSSARAGMMTVFRKLGVTQRVGITGGAVPVGRLDHKHFGVCSVQGLEIGLVEERRVPRTDIPREGNPLPLIPYM